jgi:hypothetical protein
VGSWPVLSQTRFANDDVVPSTYNVVVSSPGAANTKGSYSQIVAAAPFDVGGLLLQGQINTNSRQFMDIALGLAAAEVVVVPNVPMMNQGGSGAHSIMQKFIPLFVPKGTRIAVRQQGSGGSPYLHLKVQLLHLGGFANIEPPTRWEDWGSVLASTDVTRPTGGAAHTKGAYSQLVAATALPTRWVILSVGLGTVDDIAMDVAIGGLGSEVVVIPNMYCTNEVIIPYLLLPWTIPKGSRLAARVAAAGGASSMGIQILGGG